VPTNPMQNFAAEAASHFARAPRRGVDPFGEPLDSAPVDTQPIPSGWRDLSAARVAAMTPDTSPISSRRTRR
jgi:hypothetical protein